LHGSGTIVTGTLGSGTVRRGDVLLLRDRPVTVRALQCQGRPVEQISGTARVALNLRGIARTEAHRGDSLLTQGAWLPTTIVDVRTSATELPAQIVAHIGSAAVPATVRPLTREYDGDNRIVRLTFATRLPLKVGDRLLLRDPGRRLILGGASVLDPAPPPLRRRGAARARTSDLDHDTGVPNLESELSRRGVASVSLLRAIGVTIPEPLPKSALVAGSWMVYRTIWDEWIRRLDKTLGAPSRGMLVDSGVGRDELVRTLELPDARLLNLLLASRPDLEEVQGRVRRLGQTAALRPDIDAAVDELITDLHRRPFSAPDQPALAGRGLGPHELGAAAATGRVLLLPGLVVLLPSAPAEAVDRLLRLPQPFTLSGALGTTRRVAVPLLEYLDGLRLTERVGSDLRQVRSHGAKTPVR
jgi:selenocysteine-specific elongation factor